MNNLQKNSEYIVDIHAIGYNGEGISKNFDIPIFVPLAMTGEQVKIKIILVKKNFAVGKLLQVVQPSIDRTMAPCPLFGKCGGCDLQHINYKSQLKFKQNHVKDCFKKIANMDADVLPTVASSQQFGYRNKFSVPVRLVNGEVQIGFFASNSHRVVPLDRCLLQEEWADTLLKTIKNFIKDNAVSVYHEEEHKGLLRHIVARKLGNALQLALVINGKTLPNVQSLCNTLAMQYETISVYLNHNTQANNVILSSDYTHVFGKETITEHVMGLSIPIVPASFMQVNNGVRDAIYAKALEVLSENTQIIVDAYSGAGTLTNLIACKHPSKQVFGIEIVPEAVQAANQVAKTNNISNITNILGDCEVELPQFLHKHSNQSIALILDPPRKGCSKSILQTAVESDVQQIVYISCDPSTLARDIKLIFDHAKEVGKEYKIEFLQPYDMFPQTKHVETLVVLNNL